MSKLVGREKEESAKINQALIDLDKSLFRVTRRSPQALRAGWRSDNSLRSGLGEKPDIQRVIQSKF